MSMSDDAATAQDTSESRLDDWLAVLGNDTRRALITHLARIAYRGESSIGELAFAVGESRFSVSRHVQTLRDAGLVTTEKHGRHVVVSLVAEPFHLIDDWIWSVVDALERRPVL